MDKVLTYTALLLAMVFFLAQGPKLYVHYENLLHREEKKLKEEKDLLYLQKLDEESATVYIQAGKALLLGDSLHDLPLLFHGESK